MHFYPVPASTKAVNLLQTAGYYQAPLEDISLCPFLVARAGYAMLGWCVSGLEQGGRGRGWEKLMGRLTTHILDTAAGRPAKGIRIELHRLETSGARVAGVAPLLSLAANADGRCDHPLLEGGALLAGVYELVFQAGRYFADQGVALPTPPFLDEVVIRFGIADPAGHYHVPLLISPYGYSTYRGS